MVPSEVNFFEARSGAVRAGCLGNSSTMKIYMFKYLPCASLLSWAAISMQLGRLILPKFCYAAVFCIILSFHPSFLGVRLPGCDSRSKRRIPGKKQ